jgi:hypothetical protein
MEIKIQTTSKDEFNIFIGGHYNFPNLPSEFAENSLNFVANLKQQVPQQSTLLSFINDIRFSNFCSIGACELDLTVNAKIASQGEIDLDKILPSEIANYDKHFSFLVSDKIKERLQTIIQMGYLKELSNYVINEIQPKVEILRNNTGMKLSALYYIFQASKQYVNNGYKNDIIFAMDYFMYCLDKDNFVPFQFKQSFNKLDVIWEKSIYNYASKTIRKFHEKGLSNELVITENNGTTQFSCKAFDGSIIELRKEETSPYFNAVNKCPLIIATLYYKVVSTFLNKSKKINIYYVIPSYDRSRVNLGTEAFFKVYFQELQKNSPSLSVNIHNIYWIEPQSTVNIVDTYSENSKSISIYE